MLKMNKDELFEIINPYTVLSQERKNALYDCACEANLKKIDGDFVECGVFNGGSAGILGSVMLDSELKRNLWLFDSFEGLPNPTLHDIDSHGVKGEKGLFSGSEARVNELIFDKLKINQSQANIIKGWFDTTIPKHEDEIKKIALLHLDCDFYESVKICLENLFDKIQSGGYLVIDDYGRWKGCKVAIDEFFAKNNLELKLEESDYTGRYYQKI